MTWISITIQFLFGLGLFINAALFIPQAIKLFKKKDSKELSLVTFLGFNIIQFFAILNGILHKDYVSIVGWTLSLITSGTVTFLIVFYKNRH